MSKHTPGPWVWISATAGERDDWGSPTPGPIDVSSFRSNSYSSNPELVGADGDIVVSAGGGEYVPYHGQTDIRMVANARLIAAAPAMIDALCQWAWAEEHGDDAEMANARKARDAAIDAARKEKQDE